MLYELVKTLRGKDEVVMVGEMPAVRNRRAELQKSQGKHLRKGGRVSYAIRLAGEGAVKFKKRRKDHKTGGGDAQTPRLTKWD